MEEATSDLQKTNPSKALPEQEKAEKTLQDVRQQLAELIALERKELVDPLAKLQKVDDELARLIKEQKDTRDQTKEVGTDKQNPKLPALADKQDDLTERAKVFKQEPLPGQPEVQDKIDEAVAAMKKATEDLKARRRRKRSRSRRRRSTALENLKKDLDKKIERDAGTARRNRQAR